MKYFITGHTGFKGSWLSLLLSEAGHEIFGLSLDPEPGSLFERAELWTRFSRDFRGDIRDADVARSAITEVAPDVVIHLAAQPLVRDSYARPRWTMETNVMGTLSVLEAVQATTSVAAVLAVTTDKVYRNVSQEIGYVESDPLGGHDPYSASKAMSDILISSWVSSFPGPPTGIARAGNVIGGGDVSQDRLFPDLLRSFEAGETAVIRYPDSVRPWQHVLDCLNGYLLLTNALIDGKATGAWNFGPDPKSFRTVADLATAAADLWGADASWAPSTQSHPHEAALLMLDSSNARAELGWKDQLTFEMAVDWTVEWTKRVAAGESTLSATVRQIREFGELTSN
jgi:CDP-glucose 4,6-dehydratase